VADSARRDDDSTLSPAAGSIDGYARAALPVLAPGTVIAGRFRLEKSLGEGGMGVVWEAVHLVTRKPVALKFLKRKSDEDPRAIQRFLREARAACAVRHPCVVEVHDVVELWDGSPVMVMDLLEGETIGQRLAREHTLSLPELARIMVHVCSAVGCAHALGIVHRDLKPENIFLARSATGPEVKVLDFGIAKLTASEGDAARTGATTGTGAILGTPYYMAPEQLFGEKDVDHRADIWALGIIFYEALTGVRPTHAENLGQILKIITTDAIVPLRERMPSLPEPVLELVSQMLSHDRTKRPAGVREVLSVLEDYTSESFVSVDAPPAAVPRDFAYTPPRVDSDAARASTVDAASDPLAAWTPAPPPAPAPRKVTPLWRKPVVWGVTLMIAGAAGAWSLRGSRGAGPATANGAVPPSVTSAPADLAATPTAAAQPSPTPTASATTESPSASTPAPPPMTAAPKATATRRPAPHAGASVSPHSAASASTPQPKPSATMPRMSEDL
jgi:eukaryotic-like serine/threonine-protein kinase